MADNQKFKLSLKLVTKGFKKAEKKINKVNKSIRDISGTGFDKIQDGINRVNKSLLVTGKSTEKFINNLNAMSQKSGFASLGKSADKMQKLSGLLKGIKVSPGVEKDLFKMTQHIREMDLLLRSASDTMANLGLTSGELQVGRMMSQKGPDRAVREAIRAKVPINEMSARGMRAHGLSKEAFDAAKQSGILKENAKTIRQMADGWEEVNGIVKILNQQQSVMDDHIDKATASVEEQRNALMNVVRLTRDRLANEEKLGTRGPWDKEKILGFSQSLTGVEGGTKTATAALAALNGVIGKISTAFQVASMGVKAFGTVLKAIGGFLKKHWIKPVKKFLIQLKDLRRGIAVTVDGMRQFTQGLLSVARAMTFFVAIPITAFLREGVKNALEFEKALARVKKVTGDMIQGPGGFKEFREEFGRLAAVSISSVDDFAMFAEQFGQIGVQSKEGIMNLVALADVVAGATDISEEEVASAMGSISNAFGHALSGSRDQLMNSIQFLHRMMDTVNELENTVGTSGGAIIEALKDTGSAFSDLTNKNLKSLNGELIANEAITATWIALGDEFGMTASEVGTAMKNLPGYVARYADKITELNPLQKVWSSETQFLNDLNQDFFGTMDELTTALAGSESALESLVATQELAGRRSGRLITNLVKSKRAAIQGSDSMNRYRQALELAHKAFSEGGSIQKEYNTLLETASASTKLLQHNVKNLGLSLSDDLLPLIVRFTTFASQGVMALTDVIGGFSQATKFAIGKVLGLAALYGPVSWFFSQVAFGLSMATEGILKFGAFIAPAVKLILSLVRGVMTLNPVLMAFFAIVHKLTGGLGTSIENIIETIDTMIETLTGNLKEGGEAIMGAFATGIKEGSQLVIASAKSIAEILQAFLMGKSPAEMGPLSTIDMWGEPLMRTWLESFENADFGILSDLAKRAEEILTAIHFTPEGEGDRKKVLKDLIDFRERFSELLKDYEEGVKITEEYLDNVVDGLGSGKDELKELIRLNLEYKEVQERLQEIEKERADIQEDYKSRVESIRLGGGSAEQQVEQIASAQSMRDQGLRALSEEERALEKRESLLEQQLEIQQQMLDAMSEQSALWQELMSVEAGGGGAGDISEALGGGLGGTDIEGGIEDLNTALQDAKLRFLELRIGANRFKVALLTIGEVAGRTMKVLRGELSLEEAFDVEDVKKSVLSKLEPGKEVDKIVASYMEAFNLEENSEAEKILDAIHNEEFMAVLVENGSLFGTKEDIKNSILDYFEADAIPEGLEEAINREFGLHGFTDLGDELNKELIDKLPEVDFSETFSEDDLTGVEDFVNRFVPASSGIATGIKSILDSVKSGTLKNITDMWDALKAGATFDETWTNADGEAALSMANAIGQIIGAFGEHGADILDALGDISSDAVETLLAMFDVEFSGADDIESVVKWITGLIQAFAEEDKIVPIMVRMRTLFVTMAEVAVNLAIALGQVVKWVALFTDSIDRGEVQRNIDYLENIRDGLQDMDVQIMPSVEVTDINLENFNSTTKEAFTAHTREQIKTLLTASIGEENADKFYVKFAGDSIKILPKAGVDPVDASELLDTAEENLLGMIPQLSDRLAGTKVEFTTPIGGDLGFDNMFNFPEFVRLNVTADSIDERIEYIMTTAEEGAHVILSADTDETADELERRLKDMEKDREVTFTVNVKYPNGPPPTGTTPPPKTGSTTSGQTATEAGAKQGGGRVYPGRTYRVLESGPELFTPFVGGKITPHTLLRGMGEKGGDSYNIEINNPSFRDERDMDELVETILYEIGNKV